MDLLHPSLRENFAATMTDEDAARRLMNEDPTIAGGFACGELRPFRVSLLRGRDPGEPTAGLEAGSRT